ncbi:hypothetical protein ACFY7C_14860 [Streptomyces sp. NPDC012769]|uniref:hypothetical protein n=1 Tax=Streptomyces sp. NPDC012769 TaxID=3364848 RepID=UPI0036C01B2D
MTARPSEDLPGTFARLGGDADGAVWSELWDDLCHQGSVYEDSFLALPYLAAIAAGRAAGSPMDAVLMAGLIVSAADGPRTERYAAEIAALLPVAGRLLDAETDDPALFVYLLQCVLAFEGERVWSAGRLEGLFEGEYEVECADCFSEFAVGFADPGVTPVEPADGLPARLRRTALEAGHTEVAHGVTVLFGRAVCPDCGTAFTLADRVAARHF